MFEVATLSGNRIESACALKAKTKTIMGQIIGSSGASGKHENNKTKSLYKRQLSVQPMQRKSSKRESRHAESARESILRVKNETNKALNNGQIKPLPDRPVTINAFNLVAHSDKDSLINGDNLKNLSIDSTTSSKGPQKPLSSKEFYKSGEGYHKTDVCYYKTLDGGYHKLPHDSYHKMTVNCYVKIQDGSFRKFDDINNSIGGNSDDTVQLRVKSHVKRFLNRSKSHTPATIKEMQRAQKDGAAAHEAALIENNTSYTANNNHHHNQSSSSGSSATTTTTQPQNRRVMVTMIEGGMPVVATSKASSANKSSKSNKNRNSTNNKVNKMIP